MFNAETQRRRDAEEVWKKGDAREQEEHKVTDLVLGSAITVHRAMGPGLLESIYEECLAREFVVRGVPFERQRAVELSYRGEVLAAPLRLDFLVADLVVVELKSVERLLPVHEAQLLSYVRLSGCRVGLLLNFNVSILREGVRRKSLTRSSSEA